MIKLLPFIVPRLFATPFTTSISFKVTWSSDLCDSKA